MSLFPTVPLPPCLFHRISPFHCGPLTMCLLSLRVSLSLCLSGFGFGDLSPPLAMKLWYDGGNSALPNGGFVDQGQAYPCKSCCATTTPTMAPTALPLDCAAALSKTCGQAKHDGGVRVCKGCCDAHTDVLNKTCTADESDTWCTTS